MMVFYPKYLFAAGFTPFPWLMFIRADSKGSVSLHKHEETHQQQMRDDGILLFWFRYLFSKQWRLQYEVEAYKVQIAAGAPLEGCADYLSRMYYLDITIDQARKLLLN